MERENDIEQVKTVLLDFMYNIKHCLNFAYTKFGDGEAICMSRNYLEGSTNCDGQAYSNNLANDLFDAANYFSRNHQVFIGKWIEEPDHTKLKTLFKGLRLNYVSYCTLLHVYNECLNESRRFYKAIKESNRRKFYVGNSNMKQAANWLGAMLIEVPKSNAYDSIDNVLFELCKNIKKDDIILYSAGLMSKVLIHQLHLKNSETTHLDVGSGLDNVFVGYTREKQINTMYLKQFYQVPL